MTQETDTLKSKKSDVINGTHEAQDFICFESNDSVNHKFREALEVHKFCGQTGEHEIDEEDEEDKEDDEEFEIVDGYDEDEFDIEGFEEEDAVDDDDLDELAEKSNDEDSVSMHRYYIGALTF